MQETSPAVGSCWILLVTQTINHGLPFSPVNYLFEIYLFHTIYSICFQMLVTLFASAMFVLVSLTDQSQLSFKMDMATKWDRLIPPPPLIHVPVYKLANNRGWERAFPAHMWHPSRFTQNNCNTLQRMWHGDVNCRHKLLMTTPQFLKSCLKFLWRIFMTQ